jgi:hypothetical protein
MSRENVARFHHIYEEWYARRKLGPDFLATSNGCDQRVK